MLLIRNQEGETFTTTRKYFHINAFSRIQWTLQLITVFNVLQSLDDVILVTPPPPTAVKPV